MSSANPKLVGVTGGIGSGKSTVCKIFEVLGHTVYYADDRAKWLMVYNQNIRAKIVSLFGKDAYHNNELNRKLISSHAFKKPDLLERLNAIVHPEVANDLAAWVHQHKTEKLLFDEAALLFETGSYKKLDATILVTAPEHIRISRVLKRDSNRTKEAVQEIIAKQLADEEKLPLADYVITNDGSSSLLQQTIDIHEQLQ